MCRDDVAIIYLVACGVLACGCLPAQESFLPAPTGPFSIGRTLVRWTDATRAANPLDETGPKRDLAVWIWYPASPQPGAQRTEWAPGKLGEATFAELPKPAKEPLTKEVMHTLRTHAYADALVSSTEKSYPLVLFSPGLGQQPSAYADIIEDLVSHGYIVAGIVPTGSVAIVLYPDGQAAPRIRPKSDALGYPNLEEFAFYAREAPVWAADMRFVLNQLAKLNEDSTSLLRRCMDFSRVGAFGHSFGGTTSVQVALEDPRVKAAIDIDGYIYGTATAEPLGKPFLYFRSDQTARIADLEKLPPGDFKRANLALRQRDFKSVYNNAKPGYGVFLAGAEHMFSWDVPLIPFVPESYRVKQMGPIGGERAHAITKAYVDAFFEQYLKGKKSQLLTGPSPAYPEVTFETNSRHAEALRKEP